jgi:hypothetical protein
VAVNGSNGPFMSIDTKGAGTITLDSETTLSGIPGTF